MKKFYLIGAIIFLGYAFYNAIWLGEFAHGCFDLILSNMLEDKSKAL